MLQFLKYVFATIVGLFLFIILGFFILIGIISASLNDKNEIVKENSILKLNLDKVILEREMEDFWAILRNPFEDHDGTAGLLEIKKAISKAKDDNKIKGILIEVSNIQAGFATIQEIRNSIEDFKKTGKFVAAYGESFSEGSYFVASAADKIFLPPTGILELNGLVSQVLFFKGTLDKLDIQPEVFKVGEYKSAVEPFLLKEMSEPNRQQLNSLLTTVNNVFLANVAESRNIPIEKLKLISDSMLVRNAADALEFKLVTDIGYFDNVEDFIRTKLKSEKDDKINYINHKSIAGLEETEKENNKDRNIAVIYATGEIESGKGELTSIGSETLSKEIRKARLDEDVKAVVLRINSPGGSALASDVIWREVVLTRKVKPIIASMSDVAASGGYYIAMGCDTIVAQPTTITGSIGVFGLLFNIKNFLNNKLGITTDKSQTGTFSDIGSITRELSPYEEQIIQNEVKRIYVDFLAKAAAGRDVSVQTIENVAEGRVWSGLQAKDIKLVDIFGGLDDAIKIAATKANLGNDYSIKYLPEPDVFFLKQLLFQLGQNDDEAVLLKSDLGKFYPYIKSLKDIRKFEGIQARLPYDIIIK